MNVNELMDCLYPVEEELARKLAKRLQGTFDEDGGTIYPLDPIDVYYKYDLEKAIKWSEEHSGKDKRLVW
jgi:hypothetical protein